MSRYKAYPAYRDSGVEWLGDIPPHWLTSKLRYGFSFGKGLSITKENLVDEGIPCVNYGEVHSKFGFEVDPGRHALKCVDVGYLKSSGESLIKNGDFVFADTSEDIEGSGNFTQLRSDAITFAGYHTIIARPNNRKSARYFAYLFDSKPFRTQIRHAVKGVKVFSITQAILRGADIWLPSQDEQEKIAAFLDHETAKIDALIEKQQRLIELLKEKRQAVISHAVTKGLNPNAPMKDSGVEWLGEVPAHWGVRRVKFVSGFTTSGPRGWSELVGDDGSLFIQSGDLNDALAINFENANRVQVGNNAEAQRTLLCDGDVLVCITGAKTGNVAVCSVVPEPSYINQHLCLIRPTSEIEPVFLAVLLKSCVGQTYFELSQYGLKQGLSLEDVREAPVFLPPLAEQTAVVAYITAEAEKFDVLCAQAQQSKELLQERRTALISAAVTGKIDVRDWQPAAA